MAKRNKSIGIFDSGFGGLTTMKEIIRSLPKYDYIYLGDTARMPYGDRSRETVYEFSKQAVDFLFEKNCELIVFACNTVSSDALRKIQKEYLSKKYPDKKVLGVIVPVCELAILDTKNGRIGIIATNGTVSSGAFPRELLKIEKSLKIFQKACPLLVPLIENGEHESEILDGILKKYLRDLLNKRIDTLILGCTHYRILEHQIKEIVGDKIKVVAESKIVAQKLKDYLNRHPEIERKLGQNHKRTFYSTDLNKNFQVLGSKFFGQKIKAQKAELK
jgi:glutamate racemase